MTIRVLGITGDPDRPTAATFIGLRSAGIDLRAVRTPSEAANEALHAAGVPLLDIPVDRRAAATGARRLRAELQQGRYDILHLFGNRALENGLRASRGLPVRIVAYRGIVGNVSFLSPVSWRRYLNPRIDRIVCVADAVRDHFLNMRPSWLRMPAERLVTIHKGHSLDWYADPPADLRALGVPPDAFTVVCVANYRPRKGIELLVEAMPALPDEVHLLLVGHMDSRALHRRIAANPASSRIHRPGYLTEAPAVAGACDVAVLPSIKREGLPRSVIEAMAYKTPPIVTDSGGNPELVVDGISGLVVPARDSAAIARAIRRLHDDAELRNRMGAAARERIRTHFRIEDTIAKTEALYRDLAST
ncbi:MAG: glycosyltransferase family 4 protein [Proteobacteria bacterium]|nr:glycosyltransferase family 4 protein [Pseudomonadota bacterium]MYJ95349.1 glycosyltransferase family 4 protein [Pseudomonadota bacterium]